MAHRLDRLSDVRFLASAVVVAFAVFLLGKWLGAPGKGVVAAGFAIADLVSLTLYRGAVSHAKLAASTVAILVVQIIVIVGINETPALYHGAIVMPVALASFLAFVALIQVLQRIGPTVRS